MHLIVRFCQFVWLKATTCLIMGHCGIQMLGLQRRLLWASRSPLQPNDLFKVALRQLNTILVVCVTSFISQVRRDHRVPKGSIFSSREGLSHASALPISSLPITGGGAALQLRAAGGPAPHALVEPAGGVVPSGVVPVPRLVHLLPLPRAEGQAPVLRGGHTIHQPAPAADEQGPRRHGQRLRAGRGICAGAPHILRSGQDMPGVGSLLIHLMSLAWCVMQALLSNSDDESGGSRRESYEEEGQAGDAGVPGENDLAGPLLRRGASGVQRQSTERSSR